ncbi:HD domain-containing protein [Patescibacteria group bacterium]|nr:HD domain-containing protein [Patescibacteria group bacterium]
MKYIDQVYGEFEITDPIILELIESASIQRLKGIDQAGYRPLYRPLWVNPDIEISEHGCTRFAHSIGVYLLLRKYNAPIEEQIAGLIHDVSHLTFSHCIDYVLDAGSEKEQNHQDNIFEDFVLKTKIPQILKKYGFNIDYILDESNFPLKENELPDICADRIDYSLRDAVIFNELDNDSKKYILDNLTVENNKWIFKNFESAKKFAEVFLKMNTNYYACPISATMFRVIGDCLRYALQKEYISESDFCTTDELVIEKIKRFVDKDEELKLLFDRMNNKTKIINNPNDYDVSVFCKSRVVDPLFKDNGEVKRVSEFDSSWVGILKEESKPKQYFLKFDK